MIENRPHRVIGGRFRMARALRKHSRAMSLLELLVVICLIAMLMALTVPALVNIAQGQGMKRAVTDISGILESARAEAMAASTWVWVGLADTTATNAVKNRELTVAVVSSRDGSSRLDAANLSRKTRPARFENVILLPDRTAWATNPSVAPLKNGDYQFTCTIAGQSKTFSGSVLAFSPRGEAVLQSNAVSPWIEVGLRESRGGVEKPERTGSILVSGVSGQVIVTY